MNKRFLTSGCAAVLAATTLMGCGGINPSATLVDINTGDSKDTISLGYGNFVARYQQATYDQFLLAYYGESMWTTDMSGSGSTFQDDTKDGILDDMEEQYLCKLHAADYDIALTDEQNTAIADAAAQFIKDNPEDTLEVMGATEEYVKQFLEYRTYNNLVQSAVKEEGKSEYKEDEYWMRTFSYVLVDTTGAKAEDGTVTEYTDEELAGLKEQAETIAAADDFDAAVTDAGLTAQTYSYLKGEEEDETMDMSIIEAAEKMSEGDVSDVIEIDGVGYYVIRLDADHDEEASETKLDSLTDEYYNDILEAWKGDIVWKVNEKAWKTVQFDTLFKSKEDETATEETTDETTESTNEPEESTEEITEESTEEEEVAEQSEDEPSDETSEESTDGAAAE
ncbi:MAG: peptidyl-prolyl cis-trans isomerase [Pseudobutyrivibrio sp.]|nr:peptidyl-prolyl cis-trans isomerase [Pseudobutyrivibrio sp.]